MVAAAQTGTKLGPSSNRRVPRIGDFTVANPREAHGIRELGIGRHIGIRNDVEEVGQLVYEAQGSVVPTNIIDHPSGLVAPRVVETRGSQINKGVMEDDIGLGSDRGDEEPLDL